MKNIRIIMLLVIVTLVLGCHEENIQLQKEEFDIEKISNSEAFREFKESAINFNEPYFETLSSINNEEKEELYLLAKVLSRKDKENISEKDYSELITKMGYDDIEDYETRGMDFISSYQNLIKTFPEFTEVSEEQEVDLMIDIFSKSSIVAFKSSPNCTYNFSYCMEMAKGYYIAVSGTCAVGLLGGPIGAIGAALCQVGNTAYYEGAKQECAHSYELCMRE